jgi:tetratricopeptide (TPR) repeat protein
VHDIFIEHRPTSERLAIKEANAYLRILEEALRLGDRSAHTLFFYANELRASGRYREAIAVYEEFLESAERSGLIYHALKWISRCHLEFNEPEQALSWAVRATKQDPNRAEAFNDAGLILYSQKRFTEAIPFFHEASTLPKPQDVFPVEHCHYEWLPLDYLSSCHMALGQFSKACEFAQMAVRKSPANDRLMSNLLVLSKLSRTEG